MPRYDDITSPTDGPADDEIGVYPTDRIGLQAYDKDVVVLTVHYYANPADYEAQKSIAMNYLMTRHGAR
jgi:hypothetical protein